ncbi:MAG: PUA domain-containing protein [Nanobdellota archaeon]
MKKKILRKSEIREINAQLTEKYGWKNFFDRKDTIEKIDNWLIVKNDDALFFYQNTEIIPTLRQCLKNCPLKEVIVDMGAIRFISGGADIMKPGISQINQEIKKEDYVVVKDIQNEKPIAIAKALYSAEDIKKMENGKVLMNLHYAGDEIWNFNKQN